MSHNSDDSIDDDVLLDGLLAVNDDDVLPCWHCRRGIDMATLLVIAREKGGGSYHLACAASLGWVPTDLAAASIAAAPRGPYVIS